MECQADKCKNKATWKQQEVITTINQKKFGLSILLCDKHESMREKQDTSYGMFFKL